MKNHTERVLLLVSAENTTVMLFLLPFSCFFFLLLHKESVNTKWSGTFQRVGATIFDASDVGFGKLGNITWIAGQQETTALYSQKQGARICGRK